MSTGQYILKSSHKLKKPFGILGACDFVCCTHSHMELPKKAFMKTAFGLQKTKQKSQKLEPGAGSSRHLRRQAAFARNYQKAHRVRMSLRSFTSWLAAFSVAYLTKDPLLCGKACGAWSTGCLTKPFRLSRKWTQNPWQNDGSQKTKLSRARSG